MYLGRITRRCIRLSGNRYLTAVGSILEVPRTVVVILFNGHLECVCLFTSLEEIECLDLVFIIRLIGGEIQESANAMTHTIYHVCAKSGRIGKHELTVGIGNTLGNKVSVVAGFDNEGGFNSVIRLISGTNVSVIVALTGLREAKACAIEHAIALPQFVVCQLEGVVRGHRGTSHVVIRHRCVTAVSKGYDQALRIASVCESFKNRNTAV